MAAVLFGRNNKKRKRGDIDGLEDLDEAEKRRRKLMDERLKQL